MKTGALHTADQRQGVEIWGNIRGGGGHRRGISSIFKQESLSPGTPPPPFRPISREKIHICCNYDSLAIYAMRFSLSSLSLIGGMECICGVIGVATCHWELTLEVGSVVSIFFAVARALLVYPPYQPNQLGDWLQWLAFCCFSSESILAVVWVNITGLVTKKKKIINWQFKWHKEKTKTNQNKFIAIKKKQTTNVGYNKHGTNGVQSNFFVPHLKKIKISRWV